MAVLMKAVHASKNVNNILKLFTNLSLTPKVVTPPKHVFLRSAPALHSAFIHTTPHYHDLMEFFEEPKNWGKNEIKVGRSWRRVELRWKSNSDLHKLWYVLLKERNMLLTMEEICKSEHEIFPNPERIDKIKRSMINLELVVRERNRAYHTLETGETGERPGKLVYNRLGMKFYHRMRQYIWPKHMNRRWHKWHLFGFNGHATRKFQRLYKEKLWNIKRKRINRSQNRVATLLSKFPNMDIEALKKTFPNVNIEKARSLKRARGHHIPE